ncbi:MAG TPA: hypothetical protein VGF41_10470 [Myxococcaceae bacterium]
MRKTALLVALVMGAGANGEERPAPGAAQQDPKTQVTVAAVVTPPSRVGPSPEETSPGPAFTEGRYAGTYVYVGDEAERVEIKAAVNRATEHMFGKVIAREELMKRSEIRPSYTIRLEPSGSVTVETPGFPRESSPLDGTEVELRTKYGDVVRNSHRFVDGALVERARTQDGNGSTEFRLERDGNTLIVTCVSRSPKLPGVVVYTLTYRRREPR